MKNTGHRKTFKLKKNPCVTLLISNFLKPTLSSHYPIALAIILKYSLWWIFFFKNTTHEMGHVHFYDMGFLFHLLKPSPRFHFPSMFKYLLKNLTCSLRTTTWFQSSAISFIFSKLLVKLKEVNKVVFFLLSLHERKTPPNIHLDTTSCVWKANE